MPILLPPFSAGLGSGAGEYLPGSGLSAPAGLETLIEYGGLMMNDNSVMDKFRIMEIAGTDDAEIRSSYIPNPGEHGEVVLESFYGGRTVVITGRIEAGNLGKLRDMQQALRTAFVHVWHEHPLIFHTGQAENTVFIDCKKSAPIAMREAHRDFRPWRDFQVTLRASNPRVLSYMEELNQATLDTPDPDGSVFMGVLNRGNFGAQPRIRLGGTLTDPVVSNDTNGQSISLTGTIADGDYVEIDVARKTIVDQTGANQFSLLSVGSDWMELEPGYNDISIVAASSADSPYLYMWHRHTWM